MTGLASSDVRNIQNGCKWNKVRTESCFKVLYCAVSSNKGGMCVEEG